MEVAQGEAEDGPTHRGMSRRSNYKLREAKARENKQQSADACESQSLGPHSSDRSCMADAVDVNERRVQQLSNYQAIAHHCKLEGEGCEYHRLKSHKRRVVQVEVEERSDVKRAKWRDGGSKESKLFDATVKDETMVSKSISECPAEEQYQKRLKIEQRCFERPQEECRIPSVVLGSLDHVQRNTQQAWITNSDYLEAIGQDCPSEGSYATFVNARQDSRALQLRLTRQSDRPKRRATRLDPWGSTGDGTVVVLQQEQYSFPSLYGHGDKIAMLEGGDDPQTVLPNSEKWQRLLAPEALQILFPTMSMHKQETTYVERIPALTVSNLGLAVRSEIHRSPGNVELAQETATQPTTSTETHLTDTVCHFDRFLTPLTTDTQHLASSLAPSQHEANTDRPQINPNAADFYSHNEEETMASQEGTTEAPHHMAEESTVDASCSLVNDQDLSLRQPPQPEEELETIEDICQKHGLTLDEAEKWLDWMMQRWCEGYCMPSCTGECKKCPGQQDHIPARFVSPLLSTKQTDGFPSDVRAPASEGAGSASGQIPPSETPDPDQTIPPGDIQILSQQNDASTETVQAEGTGTAISAVSQPGENKAAIQDLARVEEADANFDFSEYFDLERFGEDARNDNVHWTGRTY